MSDLTPAAQDLYTDLRLLMCDLLFAPDAAKERVWGSADGPPRTVEESRARYYKPIVEAFAASGAETLAEFPARVKTFANAYFHPDHTDCHAEHLRLAHVCDTLKAERDQARVDAATLHDRRAKVMHERDMAKAEADRYHAELTALRESEHNARLQVQEILVANAGLIAERDRLAREAALGPDTEKPLREEARQLRAERDRYKALAEQQSATVAEGAKTIGDVRAELAATRKAHAEITALHAKAVAALSSGSLAEVEKSRQTLAARVAELLKENAALRHGIRRLCRILGKAMAGDL